MNKLRLAKIALYAVLTTASVAFTGERSFAYSLSQSTPMAASVTQAASASNTDTTKAAATVETISPQQAQKMMQAGAAMVDVREVAEWEAVRVAGSTLIPLGAVKQEPRKAALAPKVLLLCHSGRRAAVAADAMSQLKNVKLFVIEGGIMGWQKAGLPVQKGK